MATLVSHVKCHASIGLLVIGLSLCTVPSALFPLPFTLYPLPAISFLLSPFSFPKAPTYPFSKHMPPPAILHSLPYLSHADLKASTCCSQGRPSMVTYIQKLIAAYSAYPSNLSTEAESVASFCRGYTMYRFAYASHLLTVVAVFESTSSPFHQFMSNTIRHTRLITKNSLHQTLQGLKSQPYQPLNPAA